MTNYEIYKKKKKTYLGFQVTENWIAEKKLFIEVAALFYLVNRKTVYIANHFIVFIYSAVK